MAAFRIFHIISFTLGMLLLLLPKDIFQPSFYHDIQNEKTVNRGLTSAPQTTRIINGTYLGNAQRNYYGDSLPGNLEQDFRILLGKGKTIVNSRKGEEIWCGAGWTGQPLLVQEGGQLFLVIGAFDHRLKKINTVTRVPEWEYVFDDIIKGTGTIWHNRNSSVPGTEYIIMQGSRLGVENDLRAEVIPGYRGISLRSGQALWKYNIRKTPSYSRDADGSALIVNDTAYIGLENGMFAVISPDPKHVTSTQKLLQPGVAYELPLYDGRDIHSCGGNLVVESSPCLLNGHIYITTGSGHVYGYNIKSKTIDWDFRTGADMDGSPVVTADSCLLVTLEKENIPGRGGVLKLDPRKDPSNAVVWFFPVNDHKFSSWQGGVIGSAAVNHLTAPGDYPEIAAFTAIDGYLYVVHQNRTVPGKTVVGPDGLTQYPAPQLLYRYASGPSISTPILIQNRLLVAGYKGCYLFEYDKHMQFRQLGFTPGLFEATPVAYQGKVYIASRDGYLYCLGIQQENRYAGVGLP